MTARTRRIRWLWSLWPRLIASLLITFVLAALTPPGQATGVPTVQPAAAVVALDPEPQPAPQQPPEAPVPGTQCTTNPDICQPPAKPAPAKPDDSKDGEDKKAGGVDGLQWCVIPMGSLVCAFNLLEGLGSIAEKAKQTIEFALDPFGYISSSLMNGFTWLLSGLGELINKTTQVKFNNAGFVATYTQMFGLATIMTMILWLLAVAKRVVAGIPVLEAAGESIGYLVLAVMVTAFMPGAVYLVDQLFEAACSAIFSSVPEDMKAVTEGVVKSWAVTAALGGGGVFMSMIGTFLLFAVVAVWVELVIRSALIYVSLAFGPLVFSGLVDKALWSKTKKWIGITLAVESSKVSTLMVLKLAIALIATTSDWSDNAEDPFTAISVLLTALALFWLAFSAPMVIARFIPAFGDEIAAIAQARQGAHQFIRDGAAATPDPDEERENGPPRSRLEQFGDGMAKRAEQIEGWKDKLDDRSGSKDSTDQGDDDPQDTSGADSPDTDSPDTDSGDDSNTTQGSTDGSVDGGSEAERESDTAPGQAMDGAPTGGAPVDGAELGGADAATGGEAAAATGGATMAADVADKAAEFGEKAAESGASRATGQDMSGSADGGDDASSGAPFEPDGSPADLTSTAQAPEGGQGPGGLEGSTGGSESPDDAGGSSDMPPDRLPPEPASQSSPDSSSGPSEGDGVGHGDKPVWWAGKDAGADSPQADESGPTAGQSSAEEGSPSSFGPLPSVGQSSPGGSEPDHGPGLPEVESPEQEGWDSGEPDRPQR